MIVNGEVVRKVVSSAAVAEGEAVSENVVPTSVEVNGKSLGVTFDGLAALVDGHPVIATTEGLTVEINGDEVSVTFDATDLIVTVVIPLPFYL